VSKFNAEDFCQLGTQTYQGLRSPIKMTPTEEWNYVQHERIQGKPLLQQVGGKLKTWEIVWRFHVNFSNPAEEIELIRKMGDTQEAIPLTIGGKFHGYWILESMPLVYRVTDAQANLLSAEVTVKLKEWVGEVAPKASKFQGFRKVSRVNPSTFLGA